MAQVVRGAAARCSATLQKSRQVGHRSVAPTDRCRNPGFLTNSLFVLHRGTHVAHRVFSEGQLAAALERMVQEKDAPASGNTMRIISKE